MKTKILKFLKWFVTILLIVGAVGLTVFLFFKNYKAKQVQPVDLESVVSSTEKQSFDSGMDEVMQVLSTNGQNTWFNDLETTNTKLSNSLYVLINYYVEDNFTVKDEEVYSAYNSMITTRNLLTSMFNEYLTKKESQYFAKDIGANDIYISYSNYLIKYAKFVQAVNNNLKSRSGLDCTSDIKFSFIDLQTRITISTFSNVNTDSTLAKINSNTNIVKINSCVSYMYSYIFKNEAFSLSAINFIKYYESCNKTYFAEHFVELLNKTNSYTESSSNEQKSAYYFKSIF